MSSGEVQQEEEEFASRVTLQGSVENTRAVINPAGPSLAPGLAVATGLIAQHLSWKAPLVGREHLHLPWGTGQPPKPLWMEYRFLMGDLFPWKQNKVKHSPRSANNYCNKMCFY